MIKEWVIKWVLSWPSIQRVINFREMQGSIDAFEKARKDVEETFVGDVEARAKEIAEQELIKLLSVVDPKFIVKYDKSIRSILIGVERVEDGRLSNLKAEAEFFSQSELWKLIHHTPKELAQRAMFVEGDNVKGQLEKGRTMLYTLSTQQNILDIFKSYTPKL